MLALPAEKQMKNEGVKDGSHIALSSVCYPSGHLDMSCDPSCNCVAAQIGA